MSQTVIKPTAHTSVLNNQVVIQITKSQLIKFLQLMVLMAMVILKRQIYQR
jgi:hypothetical protein